jgi:ABC-type antimicrobial peptide transport system permease subunit
MMTEYFFSFIRANKIKSLLLCLSLAVYFALVTTAITMHQSIPEIASLPLQNIGVQTIVQKTGEIPGQMVGAIFPHSNAPISIDQFQQLQELPFVQEADIGLYFWYFDNQFFKAALGVDSGKSILKEVLKKNIASGSLDLGSERIVITASFSDKHNLLVGNSVAMGEGNFTVTGILRPNISGNIIPADIYMSQKDALAIVRGSAEMRKIYQLGDADFGNVVLLRGNPDWQGDKEKFILAVDKKFLVFSEKTFTKEISDQLGLISAAGRGLFLILGAILVIAFGLLTTFNLKSREREIAILRVIGWRITDLKKQFVYENLIILGVAILAGGFLGFVGLSILARQIIRMELPWDISARPHFLPDENSIERVISAHLPVHFDPQIFLIAAIGFLLLFLAISLISFHRIKRIKPLEFMR